MSSKKLWDPCVHHRGTNATAFVEDYFSREDRRTVIIGGAGFDPRSRFVASRLASECKGELLGFFIREQRPNASKVLHDLAEANDTQIRETIENAEIFPVEVFDIDDAPVGGRRSVLEIDKRVDLTDVTDLVLDCSALSTGLMYPLARYCWEQAKQIGNAFNFHIMVLDDPSIDFGIRSISCGKASPLHTFAGGLTLEENNESAKLWLPQLGTNKSEFLNLIYKEIKPHSVCPVLPFPAANPRTGDSLIEEYGDLFDSVSGPMTVAWNVDSRDIVYTHEKSPLDLYRTILRIADARKRVFMSTGGSQLILSPLGSKAVSIGLLMAALERDFAVVSVESIEYHLNEAPAGADSENVVSDSAELVHLWLHGQAYNYSDQGTEA